MISDGTYYYRYDQEGNCVERIHLTNNSITEYTWDHRNRLVNVTERATRGGAATQPVDYVYDAYSRLVRKIFDADGTGGGNDVAEKAIEFTMLDLFL